MGLGLVILHAAFTWTALRGKGQPPELTRNGRMVTVLMCLLFGCISATTYGGIFFDAVWRFREGSI